MLEKPILVDGRGHLLGRLASLVAKELLSGQEVIIVRCDEVCISGSLTRNRVKYAQFRKKHMNTNPRRGPFHFKAPARMVWRTIRGMVNHKSKRGAQALARLSTFEGIPHPYDKQKRMVVPDALRVLRLKPGRDFCIMGELAHSVGWKHKVLLGQLEDKRKVRAAATWEKRKAREALRSKAEEAAAGELTKVNEALAGFGY
jgi:large subunit ribosomal protein L13Ae